METAAEEEASEEAAAGVTATAMSAAETAAATPLLIYRCISVAVDAVTYRRTLEAAANEVPFLWARNSEAVV